MMFIFFNKNNQIVLLLIICIYFSDKKIFEINLKTLVINLYGTDNKLILLTFKMFLRLWLFINESC